MTPCNFPLQPFNTSSLFLLVAARSMFEVNPSVPSVQRGCVFFPSGCVLTVLGHSVVVVEDCVCGQLLVLGDLKGLSWLVDTMFSQRGAVLAVSEVRAPLLFYELILSSVLGEGI